MWPFPDGVASSWPQIVAISDHKLWPLPDRARLPWPQNRGNFLATNCGHFLATTCRHFHFLTTSCGYFPAACGLPGCKIKVISWPQLVSTFWAQIGAISWQQIWLAACLFSLRGRSPAVSDQSSESHLLRLVNKIHRLPPNIVFKAHLPHQWPPNRLKLPRESCWRN